MRVRLGIDLGGSFIKAGIIDANAKILAAVKFPSGADTSAARVKANIHTVYNTLQEICKNEGYKPVSVGIGSPGTISQPHGKVTDASPNIKGWQGTVLTKLFNKTSMPVYADNDANVVALAEYLVSFKGAYKNMIFITVGTGIGGGMIIDSKLYRGSNYAATEIGHITINHNGRLCKCGRKGCLEAYASVPAMMKRARYWKGKLGGKLDKNLTPQILFELYKKGNRIAKRTIIENTEYLGAGIGSLVNVLNPEIVVIGGGFSGTGREYIGLIESAIKKRAFAAATRKLKVAGARLGNNAGFVGAALLGLVDKNGKIESK